MEPIYDPDNLFLERYDYDDWFKNEVSTDTIRESNKEESLKFSDMTPLEDDEE